MQKRASRLSWPLIAILTALSSLTLISSGCQSTEKRLDAAAIAAATAKQAPAIPDYPDKCREHFKMPRDPMAGEQWVAWRGRVHIAADEVNSQIDGCAAWADDVKAGLSAPLRGAQQ